MFGNIYGGHGRPDLDRYRKRECLEAVRVALKEWYPEEAAECGKTTRMMVVQVPTMNDAGLKVVLNGYKSQVSRGICCSARNC